MKGLQFAWAFVDRQMSFESGKELHHSTAVTCDADHNHVGTWLSRSWAHKVLSRLELALLQEFSGH